MLRRKKNYLTVKHRQNQKGIRNNGVYSQQEEQKTCPLGISDTFDNRKLTSNTVLCNQDLGLMMDQLPPLAPTQGIKLVPY